MATVLPKFSATKSEVKLIATIAGRAVAMATCHGIDYGFQDAMMDLEAVHSNGCPLDLNQLAAADEGNFAHDIYGIRRHLNRKTGGLEDCFFPRYARKEAVK